MGYSEKQIIEAKKVLEEKISRNPETGSIDFIFTVPLKNKTTNEEIRKITIPPLKGFHAEAILTGISVEDLVQNMPKIALKTVALFTNLHEKEVSEQIMAKDLIYIYLAVQSFLV